MENKNYLYNNYLNMARNVRTDGNLLKALSFYKKAYGLNIGKMDTELIMDMALIYDEIGLKADAEEKYKEVLKLDEDDARAYYGLAVIYDEDGELDKAKEFYKKAIDKNENYDKAYFFLANIYDELEEKDKAIFYYKRAIEINPNDLWANANLSCIYEENNENEEALFYIDKALKIEEDNYKILFNKGVILNKLENFEEAKKIYEKSIKSNPQYPYSFLNLAVMYRENEEQGFLYYNRACFYVNIGKLDEALEDINRCIELDDLFLDYMKKDSELDPIRHLKKYKELYN